MLFNFAHFSGKIQAEPLSKYPNQDTAASEGFSKVFNLKAVLLRGPTPWQPTHFIQLSPELEP